MEDEGSVNHSPVPEKLESPIPYTFAECVQVLLNGGSVRRLSWEDERVRVTIQNDQLMIWKAEDRRFHPLIVSVGDMEGGDWVLAGRPKS